MTMLDELQVKYPGANAWQMGDSPELANELADLIKKGLKRPHVALFHRINRKKLRPGSVAITSFLMVRMRRCA